MRPVIFHKPKDPEVWYNDIEGKIIDIDKVLKEETDTHYIVSLRGETLSILKEDVGLLKDIEIDLPDEDIKRIDEMASNLGMTRDEIFNKILREYVDKIKL